MVTHFEVSMTLGHLGCFRVLYAGPDSLWSVSFRTC